MMASEVASGVKELAARYERAGSWLRNLRRYWQITQSELAEQTGAPDSAMIEWIEIGEIRLPSYMYPAFARAFGFELKKFSEACEGYYGPAQDTARSAA